MAKKVMRNPRPVPMKSSPVMMVRDPPLGVKILTILSYIGSGLAILFGLLLAVGGSAFSSLATQIPESARALVGAGLAVFGIILILFGALGIWIARKFWNGKNWARILYIIFAILGALGALVNLFQGHFGSIVKLAIDGFIAWYLLYNKEIKAYFRR
ncbi:hypothetical protein KW805_03465 [Candidatus Pacearchaeota archaeon]|nr:hypothetical protein [Candidatus Pacearchaeota archaeon]